MLILELFKLAVRVVPFKDRIPLHWPTSCPVKGLLKRVTERLHPVPAPPLGYLLNPASTRFA
jgi:hypothetical protein